MVGDGLAWTVGVSPIRAISLKEDAVKIEDRELIEEAAWTREALRTWFPKLQEMERNNVNCQIEEPQEGGRVL